MLKLTLKLLLITLLTLPLFSKEHTETTASSIKRVAIALELLETMHMKHNYEGMIKRVTQMQIQQNPQLIIIRPTISSFFTKYMGWNALKNDIAKTYASNYTTKELEEIKAFYLTKVGQKSIHLMPQLASQGAKIGQQKLMLHMSELQTMIEKALKEHHTSK